VFSQQISARVLARSFSGDERKRDMAKPLLDQIEHMPPYSIPLLFLGAFLLLLVGVWAGIVPAEFVNKIKEYSGALFQRP
jgi:hypothetical protein